MDTGKSPKGGTGDSNTFMGDAKILVPVALGCLVVALLANSSSSDLRLVAALLVLAAVGSWAMWDARKMMQTGYGPFLHRLARKGGIHRWSRKPRYYLAQVACLVWYEEKAPRVVESTNIEELEPVADTAS